MSMANRIRSSIPVVRNALVSSRSNPNYSKNFATAAPAKTEKIKVPVAMYGGCANYASALYIAATKAKQLDKVESELVDLVEATKKSPTFSQFTKDLSVPSDTRSKALKDICDQAKFSDTMKNFLVNNSTYLLSLKSDHSRSRLNVTLLVVLAENGRLRHVDSIAKRFSELTMAFRGELQATVTTVIPLPAAEEKELKETLQEILGQGIKVKLEQKIDPNILGGIIVEFGQKVFDMSIRTRARQMERFLREPINI
ncbi:hypothetical protein KSS87_012287 [Heliosperma pusillum]|nr:hypothetical protein KSS87_012287 [Heliosperma pusillum]